MVFVGRGVGEERKDFAMAMSTERFRSSLHNFSLPCFKWGEQIQLRCIKVDGDGGGGGGDQLTALNRRSLRTGSRPCRPPEPSRKRRSCFEPESFERSASRLRSSPELGRRPPVSDDDEGIEAVRKKIMLDLRTQMDRMKSAVLSEGCEENEPPPPTRTEATPAPEERPWNLRARGAVCRELNANGGSAAKSQRVYERKSNFSPVRSAVRSPARRSDVGGGEDGNIVGEKKSRAKFRVPLYKQEIDEDFIAMTGSRPPRMPKKRPRNVQRQIDRLLPGLWLSEIKAGMYKVNENGKR